MAQNYHSCIKKYFLFAITPVERDLYTPSYLLQAKHISPGSRWTWAREIATGEDIDGDGFIGSPDYGIAEFSEQHVKLEQFLEQITHYEIADEPTLALETKHKLSEWLDHLLPSS